MTINKACEVHITPHKENLIKVYQEQNSWWRSDIFSHSSVDELPTKTQSNNTWLDQVRNNPNSWQKLYSVNPQQMDMQTELC